MWGSTEESAWWGGFWWLGKVEELLRQLWQNAQREEKEQNAGSPPQAAKRYASGQQAQWAVAVSDWGNHPKERTWGRGLQLDAWDSQRYCWCSESVELAKTDDQTKKPQATEARKKLEPELKSAFKGPQAPGVSSSLTRWIE